MAKDVVDKSTGEIVFPVPFVRSPYNYDMHAASNETAIHCLDPTLAVQDARDECDINTLIRRFGLGADIPQGATAPMWGVDALAMPENFQQAMNLVRAGEEAFAVLPADLRAEFFNDPARFVDFCSDPKNEDRLADLGLLSEDKVRSRAAAAQERAYKLGEAVRPPTPATLDDVVEAVKSSLKGDSKKGA